MFIIIGANGYLGSYLIKNIINNTNDQIIATYNSNNQEISKISDRINWVKLDISSSIDVDSFLKNHLKDNVENKVIYLAAYHHPDQVELNPQKAWNINVVALDNFLYQAKNKINSLYYASTDSIYGESFDNYIFNEGDNYNPVNTYGRTKAIAEQLVLMYGFSVLRFSLLMGPSIIGKKHFFDIIVNSLKEGKSIEMFADSHRSAISFDMAANFTVLLLKKFYNKKDIINIASDNHLSKLDIALGIAKKLGLDDSFIKPTSMANQDNFISKRAKNTLISNEKLKKILTLDKILYNYE